MDSTTYLNQIKSQIKEVTPEEVRKSLNNKNLVLVDIREAHEIANGVIPGAATITRSLLELKIGTITSDLNQEIILYCAGGARSALSTKALMDMGYKNVSSMSGGMTEWTNLSFEIEKKDQLSSEELGRYARHLTIPQVGEEGQMKLLKAKALLIGAGGLGSPNALYLAAAGVGTIGIVDNDVVDRSNLQRQILHSEAKVDLPKVDSAEHRLKELNSNVKVLKHNTRLDVTNAKDIIKDYDIVVNGADNFATRYLVNDACFLLKKPLVDGSIFRFDGQATVYHPTQEGPCYRCLYPEAPPPELAPSCQEAGVFGVLPGIIGVIQAVEVIKLIIGIGEPLVGKLILYDALTQNFRSLKTRKDPNCQLCGDNPTQKDLLENYEWFCSRPN